MKFYDTAEAAQLSLAPGTNQPLKMLGKDECTQHSIKVYLKMWTALKKVLLLHRKRSQHCGTLRVCRVQIRSLCLLFSSVLHKTTQKNSATSSACNISQTAFYLTASA